METESELIRLQNTLYSSKNPTRRWLHTSRRDWITSKIEYYAGKRENKNAMETGIGAGVYLPCLCSNFEHVTAIDINDSYLNHAATAYPELSNLSLIKDSITDSKLGSDSFDLILCTEVIEHIDRSHSGAAVSELHRLLRPDGILILSTPQPYSPLELAQKAAYKPLIIDIVKKIYNAPVLEAGHINLMNEKRLVKLLRDKGFEISDTYKSGVYLPVIAEFTGSYGLCLAKWIERKIRGGILDCLLWTQYYVARASK